MDSKEQQNCILCNANLKIVGIGGHIKGGWECNRCAKGFPTTTAQIRVWDRRYSRPDEILLDKKEQERQELESHELLARAARTPTERRKRKIDYISTWFKDHELRKLFKNGHEFIVFAKRYGYGSSLPAVMAKHVDILKQHKKQQIVEMGE